MSHISDFKNKYRERVKMEIQQQIDDPQNQYGQAVKELIKERAEELASVDRISVRESAVLELKHEIGRLLKDLENDLVGIAEIQKGAPKEATEYYMVKLKTQLANNLLRDFKKRVFEMA